SFPAVTLPAQTDFFLVVQGNCYLPIAASGQLVTCYNEYPTWAGPYLANYWNYRVVCAGGTGSVPLLSSASTPRTGMPFAVSLAQARPFAAAFLGLGASDQRWLGLALPFDLRTLGAPGCFAYCSLDRLDGVVTDAAGAATFSYQIPSSQSLVGAVFFNQF